MSLWPEPDPKRGVALTMREVATTLGVGANAIDVKLKRTRAGTARVAFPEPAGTALPAGWVEGDPVRPLRYWWSADIDRYRHACVASRGRRQITDEHVEAIRRMHIDGTGVNEISRQTGWSNATVSRIVNNLAHIRRES